MPESDYLRKNRLYPPFIRQAPKPDTGLIVVIPSYNEPFLIKSLQALLDCNKPIQPVEVIVVINAPENASSEVLQNANRTAQEIENFKNNHPSEHLVIHVIQVLNLPLKHAGVGLARKIGMDEASERFDSIGNPKGIIVCFDADSLCEKNYLQEIEKAFIQHPKATGASIYFEHELTGEEFPEDVYKAILLYELHLRYYIAGLRYAGFPYAYHTIGSSMAVRSDVYQKQGGMNRRKAGEDFYFLHKIIPLGNFLEINTTRVIPSPRPSERVPFGTGRAVNNFLSGEKKGFLTYHPLVFEPVRNLISLVSELYDFKGEEAEIFKKLPEELHEYFKERNFFEKLGEMQSNSKSRESFEKRFFTWLDGFEILKLVHYLRDKYYGEMDVLSAASEFLETCSGTKLKVENKEDLLNWYRQSDRGNSLITK
jgi:glycosyltransferase involved in cell wall biosynthesis